MEGSCGRWRWLHPVLSTQLGELWLSHCLKYPSHPEASHLREPVREGGGGQGCQLADNSYAIYRGLHSGEDPAEIAALSWHSVAKAVARAEEYISTTSPGRFPKIGWRLPSYRAVRFSAAGVCRLGGGGDVKQCHWLSPLSPAYRNLGKLAHKFLFSFTGIAHKYS